MKISRRGGRLRLRLERVEIEVLTSLLEELKAVLATDTDRGTSVGAPAGSTGAPAGSVDAPAGSTDAPGTSTDDPVLARLFPAGYADESASAEFRELTHVSLHAERTTRIAACRADLASSGDVDLTDPDDATRWIQTLNDLRLALGTRLGVGADDDHELDPADQPRFVYAWLTAVQDGVVTALMA